VDKSGKYLGKHDEAAEHKEKGEIVTKLNVQFWSVPSLQN